MKLIQKIKKLPKLLLVALAFVLLLNLYLSWRDSQTIDEGAHIVAGYTYVTEQDFRFNPEHPVLFKTLAGLMITPLDTKPAEDLNGWEDSNQWPAGKDLIYNSQSSARQILFLARLPSIVITLALVFATFLLGRRLFGEKVGLLAALLISIDPTLNGHGHLVTNDIFLVLGGVLFLLAAFNYFTRPDRKQLLLLSLSVLLVINTKFSGLVFLPIALLLIAIKKRWKFVSILKSTAVVFGVLGFGIWGLYGFQLRSVNQEAAISPVGDRFIEQTVSLKEKFSFVGKLYDIKIPAYSYFRGLVTLYTHNKDGHTTYFFGDRNRHGNLLYFPTAIAIKLPPVVLGANLAAILVLLLKRKSLDKSTKRKLLLSGAFIGLFVVIGVFSRINIGIRHVFGAWPFFYIIGAMILIKIFGQLKNRRGLLLAILAMLYIPVLIATIRTPIAYQNAFGDSIEQVSDRPILIDSNRDWSQDLNRLDEFLDKNKIDAFGEAIFSNYLQANLFGDKQVCTLSPDEKMCTEPVGQSPPCTLAISDTARWLESDDRYDWIEDSYYLLGRVGGSISIYNCR